MARIFIIGLGLLLISSSAFAAGTAPYAFTLDGQLYSTGTTTPLLDSSASVTVQIYDPAGTCLLYQETQVVNTVPSNGYFNIQVGSATGAGKRTAGVDPGNTMAKIYQNTSAIPCQSGSYTPADGDQRVVRLTVTPSASGVPDTLTPDIALNSMPMAKVAETVQGLAPASLLQVNNSGSVALTQTNLESVFTGTGWSNIQSVLAGTYSSSSSSVVASTGSVGAPSISFSGDSDTGFYSLGANRIGVTTGGSNIFSIDASGIVAGTTGGASITTAAGTAAAPTFSFAGDTGTGWFRPAASTLAASTGGAEKIRITSTGYVGIGTTTPGYLLHVDGNVTNTYASTSGTLQVPDGMIGRFQNSYPGDGSYAGFEMRVLRSDSVTQRAFMGVVSNSAGRTPDIVIGQQTGGATYAERIRVLSGGNVGIGTSAPGSSLDVKGTLRLSGSTSGYVGFAPAAAAGSTTYTLPSADGTAGQVLSTNGTGVLSWITASGGGGAGTGMSLGSVGAPSISYSGDLDTGIWSPGANTLAVSTSGAERLRVTSTGYVGVGTSAPAQAVDVSGNIAATGWIGFDSIHGNVQDRKFSLDDNVYVTPDMGVGSFTSNTWGFRSMYGYSFETGTGLTPVKSMIIDQSGLVGIGTTAPGSKLDIKGTLRLSGSTSGYVGFAPAAAAGSTTYTLPSADGTAGQVLSTNGTGVLSWTTASGGGTTGIAVGSVGTPSISFSGDTDTGWWSPGADTLAASTAGAERIRISSTGAIGVGTTTPTSLLHIKNTDGVTRSPSMITLENIVGNAVITFPYGASILNGYDGMELITNGDYLKFTNHEFRFTGNTYKLESTGDVEIISMASSGNKMKLTSPGDIVLNTYNGTSAFVPRVAIKQNGDVGIGTTSPSAMLDVGGTFVVDASGNVNVASGATINSTGDVTYSSGATTHISSGGNILLESNTHIQGVAYMEADVIAYGDIKPDTDNSVSLGASSKKFTAVYATNGTIQTSDRRQKKDIQPSDLGLDFIKRLEPVYYRWNSGDDKELHYGFIAQDTEQAIADAKQEAGRAPSDVSNVIVSHDKVSGQYGMKYTELISPVVKAIQEIYEQVQSLVRSDAEKDLKIQKLERENAAIKAYLCSKEPTAEICR